jgi:hypothetical protein
VKPGLFFTLLCVLPAFLVHANAASTVSEQSLEKELKFYRDLNRLDVDFTQRKEIKSMDLKIESQGHLTLLRPEKIVIWEIKKPSPVKVTLTPTAITMESNGDKQVFKQSEASSNEGAQGVAALMAWLNLDAHQLSSDYRITETGKETFLFEPTSAKAPFKKVEMKLNRQTLKRMVMEEISGDRLEITFGKPTLTRISASEKKSAGK